MYPEPYKRDGRANLFFNYVDPVTKKRKLKSCKTAKVGEARQYIKAFMDSLTKHSLDTFIAYSQPYLEYESNPRR